MGFQYKGVCYPDPRSAMDVYIQQFPTLPDSSGVSFSVIPSTILDMGGNGTFNVTYFVTPSQTELSSQIQFAHCNLDNASLIFDKYPIQDISVTAFLTFALLMGFSLGRRK